jgi:hypothetical protein
MSKINVNTWEPESSTALTMGASGDTTTVPSGASLVVASGATINITGATQTGFPSAGFSDVDATTATGSTTYTVPTDITKLIVFITGGGGGGGAADSGNHGWGATSGTTVIARVTVVAADTITIVIGAGGALATEGNDGVVGGDSTFTHATGSGSGSMSTITAPGGKPGRFQAAIAAPVAGTVGANNEGISILGGYGDKESTPTGGAGFWGGGGQGGANGIQVAQAGTSYGSGGGGGVAAAGYRSSAAGADGICFIMEFK